MMTRRMLSNRAATRMARAALALGAMIAGGCASHRPVPPPPVPTATYRFTIDFDGNGCPTKATSSVRNCDASLQPNDDRQRKDCLRVQRGETVGFEGKPSAGFFLQFDPFKHGTFRPPPAGGLRVDVAGNGGKPFTFNVLSDPPEKCPPLDPQIVVN